MRPEAWDPRTLTRTAGRILKSWCVVFLLCLLPFDILYRVDTFGLMDFSKVNALFDVSFFVLLLSLLSLAITLFFSILLLLPCALRWERAVAWIRRGNDLLLTFFSAYCFMFFGKAWLQKGPGILVKPSFPLQMLLLAATLAIIGRYLKVISARLDGLFSRRFQYLLVPLVAVSLVVVASKELSHRKADITPGARPALLSDPKPPNVILITFDALRAEDMPVYGYHLNTTPNIARFAGESHVIDRAFSNSNWTRPSVASLATGAYPSRHWLVNSSAGNNYLPDDLRNRSLAGLLRRHGYRTVAAMSNADYAHPYSNGTYGDYDDAPLFATTRNTAFREHPSLILLSAFVQRLPYFDGTLFAWIRQFSKNYFSLLKDLPVPGKDRRRETSPYPDPAEETFGIAGNQIRSGTSPFFAWIHIYPPHGPYRPGKHKYTFFKGEVKELRLKNKGAATLYDPKEQPVVDQMRLRYDETILYADEAFGRFVEFLKASGTYDNSIIIVTADHGESFERGFLLHHRTPLYNHVIRIPMLIRLPMQRHGKRVRTNAEQVDVLPTVLDLLNFEAPAGADGESLKNAMLRDEPSRKPKFSMDLEGNRFSKPLSKGAVAVILGEYKYIHRIGSKRGELYNLSRDPGERDDIAGTEAGVVEKMKGLIAEKLKIKVD
jgi:arylsulfatase A-like enzyme